VAELLPGGRVTGAVRVGGTVQRRPRRAHPRALAVLRWFDDIGWAGAPRVVSAEPGGPEVLTYLPGRVPWQHPLPAGAVSDDALSGVARLVRQFHDLTAGTEHAGDQEVLCHHDLAPNNTVYREPDAGGEPYAFIDWDLAGPGRRIEDVAHVCWTWLELGPGVSDLPETARRIRVILTGYNAAFGVVEVLPVVAWWQRRCWQGIQTQAHDGDPAMMALVADGTAAAIRTAAQWTDAHRGQLAAADPGPSDAAGATAGC